MSIVIYSRYSPPPQVAIKFTTPSLTEQCHKDSCDIDVILKRYQQTGFLVSPLEQTDRTPTFGDFSEVEGYFEHQNKLLELSDQFDQFPAQIRRIFGNDYQNWVHAMNDPQRTQELIDLGLLRASQTVENNPVNTEVLDPTEKSLKTPILETEPSVSEVQK